MDEQRWLDEPEFIDFIEGLGLDAVDDTVPVLTRGRWKDVREFWLNWADTGRSFLNGQQICEGIVVKPEYEKTHMRVGRVALKYVGQNYLLSKEG